MRDYLHVLSRVFDRPHMLAEDKARAIADAIDRRMVDGPGVEAAATGAPPAKHSMRFGVTDAGVAVIPVVGTLVHKAMGAAPPSGFWTYDEISNAVLEAATDPKVKGILLNVDSPGGEASDSAWQLAATIREAAGVKPVWAVADEMMASAAYLISAGASRIVMPRTGLVGSIGVIAMHLDQSAADAAKGLRYTMIYAGSRKAEFSPHAPLTQAALQRLQGIVADAYDRFVGLVADYRGIPAAAVRATEAAVFDNARDALSAGLVDADLTPREALAALEASVRGSTQIQVITQQSQPSAAADGPGNPDQAAAAKPETSTMSTENAGAAAPSETAKAILDAERARVSSILAAAMPGYAELAQKAIADGDSLASFTAAQASAERKAGAHHLEKVRADEAGVQPAAPAAPAAPSADLAGLPLDERIKAEWDKSSDLRASFADDFGCYAAYRKADAAGRVRILTGSKAA